MESKQVFPGNAIISANLAEAGQGCYSKDGVIRASLFGSVVIEENGSKRIVSVATTSPQPSDGIPSIGDSVTCRVTKITLNQIIVEIIAVGNYITTATPAKAIIRKEDIRQHDIDSIVMHQCFRPGDIVRAQVISLGDARQYFLSTAQPSLGVIRAQTEGIWMVAVNDKEVEDPDSKRTEQRKLAVTAC